MRRRHHRGARRTVHPDLGRLHCRGAQLLPPSRSPLVHRDRQGGPKPGHPLVLPVGSRGSRPGPNQCRGGRFRGHQRPKAQRHRGGRAGPTVRVLRPAYRLRPLPPAAPRESHGGGNSPVLLPPSGLRPLHLPRGGHPLLPAHLVTAVPPVQPDPLQLRHQPPPDVELLFAGFTGGQPRRHLQAVHRHCQAFEVRRRHRRGLAPDPLQGLAHPGHQRPVQRHRPVAEDSGQFGGRREPGRTAKGGGLCLPGVLAR